MVNASIEIQCDDNETNNFTENVPDVGYPFFHLHKKKSEIVQLLFYIRAFEKTTRKK